MENKNKKIIITVVVIAVIAAIIIAAVVVGKNGKSEIGGADGPTDIKVSDQDKPKNNAAPQENQTDEKTKPTFTLFYSNSDADNDATMAIVEELKAQYGEKIVFDLKNTDDAETQKIIENMPFITGQTPVLFMSTGDMKFNCKDKATMEDTIKAALNK